MTELYNADKASEKRESGTVIIGGQHFTPQRRTNALMREVRKLNRKQERVNGEIDKLTEANPDDDRIDDLEEDSARVNIEMIAVVLRDKDGSRPDVEFLDEHLDLVFAGELQEQLFPAPDPTPPTPTPTTSG